jgi:hypothetical protein
MLGMWNGWLASVNGWYAALVVAPALAVCVRPSRRRLLWVVLPALAAFWVWFAFQTRGTIPSVGELNSSAAFRPARIGPSYLSVLDLAMAVPVVLWVPFVLSYISYRLLRRHRRLPPVPGGVAGVVLLTYMALAALMTSEMVLVEYAHEDTVFADGFSLTRWRQVRVGMTKPEVHAVMGSPLPPDICRFGAAAECWVSNNSAGHFAVVWFADHRATRVYRWYSD